MVTPRMTIPTQLVLRALLTGPAREMYGLELMHATGVKSGTLYPILARLKAAGWITSRTENIDPRTAQRPARRYYRMTGDGEARARQAAASTAALLAALGGTGEADAVRGAAQAILDLTRVHTDLVKSAEFFAVLHGLYRAGAVGVES